MSLWKKVVGRFRRSAEEEPAAPPDPVEVDPRTAAAPPAGSDALRSGDDVSSAEIPSFAARIGELGGPSTEAILAWVRLHRGTAREGALVRALAEAAPRAPEVVRIAAAELLAARGEEARALEVLEGVASASALVLAADLLAHAGQMARAITVIERVLAKQIDAPGARERHARWRSSFGLDPARPGRLDEATVVQPSQEDAPFRILREVARGGAGTVYEAEDELLGRRIAFKVHHSQAQEKAAIEREVWAATSFVGPGVIRLYDASPAKGWVALEWIARGSLRDVLRRGDVGILGPPETWMAPLARALGRLHRRGWVHGDVKPANVLLRSPQDPVLGDFGLARAAGVAPSGGSPGYVSPERLAGAPVEPRDDVYGFGRIVEDVLDAADLRDHDLRRVAALCMLPADRRPAHGDALAHLFHAP